MIYAIKYSPIDALELGVDIRKLAINDTVDVRRVPSVTKQLQSKSTDEDVGNPFVFEVTGKDLSSCLDVRDVRCAWPWRLGEVAG